MKTSLLILGFVCSALAAPQARGDFHDHVQEFLDIIMAESSDLVGEITAKYIEFEEFNAGINYLKTNSFRDLVAEMESLPEFVTMINFLENDNIDIHYFLDRFHGFLDMIQIDGRKSRADISGRDLNAYMRDVTAIFPKEKLAALYDQKMEESEEFRTAITNLKSDEWKQIWDNLWSSEEFQAEVDNMNEHGLDIHLVFDEIVAIFGQN